MKKQAELISGLLRTRQWVKNLLVYVALLFTSNLFNGPFLLRVTIGFVLFSLAASSIYIINDIKDSKEDMHHPLKKNRPIASGAVSKQAAAAISAMLIIASLSGSWFLNIYFFFTILVFILMNVLYTFWLKHIVIIDVFVVAAGYVLRTVAGAFIIAALISPWLLICTTLLALFVVLSKRRYELSSITDAVKHRKILDEYSVPLLDEMMSIVTTSTIIAYSLYTFTSETASKHHYLMFTIPFVLYGIFRYLYLMHKKNLGGAPELIFLKDIPMIIDIVLWVGVSVGILYFIK
jgi:4-hydroxybenzoate polyprenyltransferase